MIEINISAEQYLESNELMEQYLESNELSLTVFRI